MSNIFWLLSVWVGFMKVLKMLLISFLYFVEFLFFVISIIFKPIFFLTERIERIPHIGDLPPALQKKFLIYFFFTNHFR